MLLEPSSSAAATPANGPKLPTPSATTPAAMNIFVVRGLFTVDSLRGWMLPTLRLANGNSIGRMA